MFQFTKLFPFAHTYVVCTGKYIVWLAFQVSDDFEPVTYNLALFVQRQNCRAPYVSTAKRCRKPRPVHDSDAVSLPFEAVLNNRVRGNRRRTSLTYVAEVPCWDRFRLSSDMGDLCLAVPDRMQSLRHAPEALLLI